MKPKLTVRDMLAIVTIAAMGLGWWVDHRRLVKRDREEHERFYRVVHEMVAPRAPTWEQVWGTTYEPTFEQIQGRPWQFHDQPSHAKSAQPQNERRR